MIFIYPFYFYTLKKQNRYSIIYICDEGPYVKSW